MTVKRKRYLEGVHSFPNISYAEEFYHLFFIPVYFFSIIFALDTSAIKPTTNKSTQQALSLSLRREASVLSSKDLRPQPGDKVCIDVPEAVLKEIQRGHGGYSARMKEVRECLIEMNIFFSLIQCSNYGTLKYSLICIILYYIRICLIHFLLKTLS